jgi:hypothetical protein
MAKSEQPKHVQLNIVNWEKYNPKRAQKTYSWLRLNNDFFEDERLYEMSAEHKLLFVVLLCLASKKNSESLSMNLRYLVNSTQIKACQIMLILQDLEMVSLIEVTTPALHHHYPYETRRDETRQVEPIKGSPVNSFDFDALYEKFPRKKGKKLGFTRMRRICTSQKKYDELRKAIDNYALYCEDFELTYVKYFSTFMNEYEDWINWSPEKRDGFKGIKEILGS